MAARDDHYRSQKVLDIVFSLSSLFMLVSVIWMFARDQEREYKDWQDKGFDVETALISQQARELEEKSAKEVAAAMEVVKARFDALDPEATKRLDQTDSPEKFVDQAKRILLTIGNKEIKDAERALSGMSARLNTTAFQVSSGKALRDSLVSQRDILLQQGAAPDAIVAKESEIAAQDAAIASIEARLAELKIEEERLNEIINAGRKDAAAAVDDLDRLTREANRLARLARAKAGGGPAAWFRGAPILDFMAPPYKVNQIEPTGLTIDYSFKRVQRNDRCTSCHTNMDRADFTKDALRKLVESGRAKKERLRRLLDKSPWERTEEENEELKVLKADKTLELTPAEIAVYCNHPRLDLYVGSNSPHPVEKFGCTICHQGQGGSATFNFAYHAPDNGKTDGKNFESYEHKKHRWEKSYGWLPDLHPNFLWEHPQLPARFVESSCLQCHHQVLDLVKTDGTEEAPKLLKGYRIIQNLGCYGCHEIAGYKSGQSIGPDLRLEPYPPIDDLSPAEKAKVLANPNDPPGQLRKNGPGLRRVAEKSDVDWIAKWVRSPRSLRPETRMPHFFGQHNNHPGQLSDTMEGNSQLPESQKGFPDAEIRGMAFYLVHASKSYLRDLHELHARGPAEISRALELRQTFARENQLRSENPERTPRVNDPQLPADASVKQVLAKVEAAPSLAAKVSKDQLQAILTYFSEQDRMAKAADALDHRPWPPAELAGYTGNPENGEKLFQLKGCLACHGNETIRAANKDDETLANLLNQARYGPNLIGLREKLNYDANNPEKKKRAESWLYAWLTNPSDYHPRTFMPNPRLEPKERADLAAWLLSDRGDGKPLDRQQLDERDVAAPEWKDINVGAGSVDALVQVYLEKVLASKKEVEEAMTKGIQDTSFLRADADERLLAAKLSDDSPLSRLSLDERKLYYLGRKSISRYGCYACHDIPGYEQAKPIGAPLNDWGRKDAARLAFDNIMEYLKDHYGVTGHGHADHGHGESDYDPFFVAALEHHRRDGFLHQKLREPRSYDYEKYKERSWDDRLKMPQFKFSSTHRRPGESMAAYRARAEKEEKEAIEAVMTFVLGLVAEPVNPKFVNKPTKDRQHEITGLKVIEKYNCNGCHVFKPGSYTVALDDEMKAELQRVYRTSLDDLKTDLPFPESSAWTPPEAYRPDSLTIYGLPRAVLEDDRKLSLEVWTALPLKDPEGQTRFLPAGQGSVLIPLDSTMPRHDPYGGLYTDIHTRILAKLENLNLVNDRTKLMGSAPPPLIRQGQKVQPAWLHQFLVKTHGIRPAVYRHLRMPQFNLSDDEAQQLVNYFIAVDRIQNPAIALEYYSTRPPQFDPGFAAKMRSAFQNLQVRAGGLTKEEAAKNDYFSYGWNQLASREVCLKCHNLGTQVAEGELLAKGPALQMAPERLRPDYVERWVSVPKRFVPYSAMPAYYFGDPDYAAKQQTLRSPLGKSAVQLGTIMPILGPVGIVPLMPATDQVYNKVQAEVVLTPAEKVRAVRDALFSWGVLVDPPPAAKLVGPRGDAHSGDQ